MDPWSAKIYVTWFVASVFIIPLLIIGVSYGAICVKVVNFNLPSSESKKAGGGGTGGSKLSYGRYRKKHSFSSSSTSERRIDNESETIDNVLLQKVVHSKVLHILCILYFVLMVRSSERYMTSSMSRYECIWRP